MEGLEVPYTKEDYKREVARELFQRMPPSEQQELFQKLPPNQRRELLGRLPLAERLSGLSAEQIETYLNELRRNGPSGSDARSRN